MEEVKNTQPSYRLHFELSGLAATSMADPTCAVLYSVIPTLAPGILSRLHGPQWVYASSVAQELWHMPVATVCSPALLCLPGCWSSFQSTVTAAMPCARYTNLPHAPDLHFPKRTHSFVQLTECIDSLTCCGVVSDVTEAEFLRPA